MEQLQEASETVTDLGALSAEDIKLARSQSLLLSNTKDADSVPICPDLFHRWLAAASGMSLPEGASAHDCAPILRVRHKLQF